MTQDFEPEIVVLYCRRSVDESADLAGAMRDVKGIKIRLVAMPCSSKVEAPHLMKIVDRGADGVVVLACPDNQCHMLVGNVRAEKRVARVSALLEQVGMGGDRVGMARGQKLSAEEVMAVAQHRANLVRPLGPNPLKEDNK